MSSEERRPAFSLKARRIAIWILKWPVALALFFLIVFNFDAIDRFLSWPTLQFDGSDWVVMAAFAVVLTLMAFRLGVGIRRLRSGRPLSDSDQSWLLLTIVLLVGALGFLLTGSIGGAAGTIAVFLVGGTVIFFVVIIALFWLWSRQ